MGTEKIPIKNATKKKKKKKNRKPTQTQSKVMQSGPRRVARAHYPVIMDLKNQRVLLPLHRGKKKKIPSPRKEEEEKKKKNERNALTARVLVCSEKSGMQQTPGDKRVCSIKIILP